VLLPQFEFYIKNPIENLIQKIITFTNTPSVQMQIIATKLT